MKQILNTQKSLPGLSRKLTWITSAAAMLASLAISSNVYSAIRPIECDNDASCRQTQALPFGGWIPHIFSDLRSYLGAQPVRQAPKASAISPVMTVDGPRLVSRVRGNNLVASADFVALVDSLGNFAGIKTEQHQGGWKKVLAQASFARLASAPVSILNATASGMNFEVVRARALPGFDTQAGGALEVQFMTKGKIFGSEYSSFVISVRKDAPKDGKPGSWRISWPASGQTIRELDVVAYDKGISSIGLIGAQGALGISLPRTLAAAK